MRPSRVTFCPAPIGLKATVPAFRPQFVFKSLDVNPMPGNEEMRLGPKHQQKEYSCRVTLGVVQ